MEQSGERNKDDLQLDSLHLTTLENTNEIQNNSFKDEKENIESEGKPSIKQKENSHDCEVKFEEEFIGRPRRRAAIEAVKKGEEIKKRHEERLIEERLANKRASLYKRMKKSKNLTKNIPTEEISQIDEIFMDFTEESNVQSLSQSSNQREFVEQLKIKRKRGRKKQKTSLMDFDGELYMITSDQPERKLYTDEDPNGFTASNFFTNEIESLSDDGLMQNNSAYKRAVAKNTKINDGYKYTTVKYKTIIDENIQTTPVETPFSQVHRRRRLITFKEDPLHEEELIKCRETLGTVGTDQQNGALTGDQLDILSHPALIEHNSLENISPILKETSVFPDVAPGTMNEITLLRIINFQTDEPYIDFDFIPIQKNESDETPKGINHF